jgi:hypothetical protein
MNRSSPRDLLADLDDLIARVRDCPGTSDVTAPLERARMALALVSSRDSTPPGPNQEARRTADERFREARRLLRGIKPCARAMRAIAPSSEVFASPPTAS